MSHLISEISSYFGTTSNWCGPVIIINMHCLLIEHLSIDYSIVGEYLHFRWGELYRSLIHYSTLLFARKCGFATEVASQILMHRLYCLTVDLFVFIVIFVWLSIFPRMYRAVVKLWKTTEQFSASLRILISELSAHVCERRSQKCSHFSSQRCPAGLQNTASMEKWIIPCCFPWKGCLEPHSRTHMMIIQTARLESHLLKWQPQI